MPTYLAGKNATVTIDGVSMKVEAGAINRDVQTDEVTNNFSGGFYEDVDTVRTATVQGMRCVYDADDPPTIDDGDLVEVSITIPSGPSLTGTFRVGSMNVSLNEVKAAVRFTFDLRSQGPYVWDWGGSA